MATLVLGGAGSGKTAYALRLALERSARATMIATAQPLDEEMARRIARHKAERGPRWRTIEEPLDLSKALATCPSGEAIVVDCLTLWLSNLMHAESNVDEAVDQLIEALATRDAILVSNEVGLGLVPETALGRAFRDIAGRTNQRIAAAVERVVFIAAGLPLVLKG